MNSKALLTVLGDQEEFIELATEVATNSKKAHIVAQAVVDTPKNKRGEFWRQALQAIRDYGVTNLKSYALGCVFIDAWLDENKEEQDAIPPASLIDLVAEVHDALFELHAEPSIQEEAAKICERWYTESRPGRERVIAQLIPTMVLGSLQTDGNPSKVYNLRETLLLFDLEDNSSLALKKLLLQCFMSPSHLNSNHGRKFLAFVMSLSEELMLAAHDSLRNQLLHLKSIKSDKRNAAISNLSRVYYGAWQQLRRDKQKEDDEAKAKRLEMLFAFESDIIQQTYMTGSVFLSDESLAKTCLKVLNTAFHDNKKDRAVDSMLSKLYEPVIWRGLSAVNASVRRNAAVVLFNAFPLHDPEARVEEISASLQRQFEAITSLLSDPCSDVRETAVEGTCRILALFWETIPVQRSSKFLQQIVNELAHDRTSPNVRASVVRSLAYMLDFPLAQPALKLALPHLKRHLHDKSAHVRLEMAKLLLKVDSTAGFKFTDINSITSVLTRLVEDDATSQDKTCSVLTELIAPSFFPLDAPSVEQLKRAKSLATSNFAASQVFFKYLHRVVGVNKTVKLALLLGSFVRARKREVVEEVEAKGEIELAVEEIRVCLESICSLWESVSKTLEAANEETIAARQALFECFSGDSFVLPLFEWPAFKHDLTLLRMCKLLPQVGASTRTALERRILREIYLSSGDTTGTELETKVTLGVHWDLSERMTKELVRSLSIHLNKENDTKRRVEPKTAIRALNQVIVTLGERDLLPTKEEELELEKDSLKRMKCHDESVLALFDIARSHVAANLNKNRFDEISACLSLLEMKLDVYASLKDDKQPRTLARALEWSANNMEGLVSLDQTSKAIGRLNKRPRTEDPIQVSDESSSEERRGMGFLEVMIHLASDALLIGCDLLDSCLFLLESALTSSYVDQLMRKGLGRLLLTLKATYVKDDRVDHLVRLAYTSSQDTQVMDQVLFQMLSLEGNTFVRSVLLWMFVESGEVRMFLHKHNGIVKALAMCLDDVVMTQDDAMMLLVEHFVKVGIQLNKQSEVRRELMRVSKLTKGNALCDRLFNLACEIE